MVGSMTRYLYSALALVIGIQVQGWHLEAGQRIKPKTIGKWDIGPPSLLNLPRLELWASHRGMKEMHVQKIYNALFRNGRAGGGAWSGLSSEITVQQLQALDLSMADSEDLLRDFVQCSSRVVDDQVSVGGGRKLVVELSSGRLVETVIIRHDHLSSGRSRYTVCVSSQVGCAKACRFCATGTMGLHAQLSSAEILEQVWLAQRVLQQTGEYADNLRNVVFMGMGEPFDNYDAVLGALRGLTHQCLFGLSAKHITVSTVGASASKIRELAEDAPGVCLALSLHGATQELRELLIPAATACPLDELAAALDYHTELSGRGVMMEYLLIENVNDSDRDADALALFVLDRGSEKTNELPSSSTSCAAGALGIPEKTHEPLPQDTPSQKTKNPTNSFVNLIPYNPTLAGGLFGYSTPSDERINAFHGRLRMHGISSLVRWSSAQGRDANGACGQLALSVGGNYPPSPRNKAAKGSDANPDPAK